VKEVRDVEGHEVLAGLSLFFLSSFHSSFSCFLGIVGGQVCFWVVKTEKGKRKMTKELSPHRGAPATISFWKTQPSVFIIEAVCLSWLRSHGLPQ